MNRWLKIFALIGLVGCPLPAVKAWNAEGHMGVAQLAYNHLNPIAKAKCDALIAVNLGTFSSAATSTFVTASVWADDFKSALGTSNWHYIDLPFSLDGTTTNGFVPPSFDVVQAINLCVTNLQNPALTQSNQAVCLRYLLHFIGDIQQPLHCSTAVFAAKPAGDAGGNGFGLVGTWSNLHFLWDDGGGVLLDSLPRPLSAASQNLLNTRVATIEADYPYDYTTNVGTLPNPLAWAQEGKGIAQTVCYVGITRNSTPSSAYLTTAMSTTEQRLAQGGHRLADLLNTLYPPNAIVLNLPRLMSGNLAFSWNTSTGGVYQVQWKPSLTSATWTVLTNLTATGGSLSFTDSVTSAQRFYRIAQ